MSAVRAVAGRLHHPLVAGVLSYSLTTLVVVGAIVASHYVPQRDAHQRGFIERFAQLDGTAYVEVVNWGYIPQTDRATTTVRLPFYPLVARAVKELLGLRANAALVVVANVSLLGALVLMAKYHALRWPAAPPGLATLTLLTMGLWPWSLFFRMAYAESLFLFVALLAMYAMERRWSPVLIALIVGFGTGVRPVGAALVAAFVADLWQRSDTIRQAARRWIVYVPLACWGLGAYMLLLAVRFGDPFSFATAHWSWAVRPTAWSEKWLSLLLFEPVWSCYVPWSETFWKSYEPTDVPWLNHALINPLVFTGTLMLIAYGAFKRWINVPELVLCSFLLLIPYATMAYDNVMISQARFACVVFPMYVVMARLIWRCPRWAVASYLLSCAALLAVYTALFGAGHGGRYLILW